MIGSPINLPSSMSSKGFSLDTHVFRYRSDRNYSIEEIENSVIWHSAICYLNDPFEVYSRRNQRELDEINDDERFKLWFKIFAKDNTPPAYWQSFSEKSFREYYKINRAKVDKQMKGLRKDKDYLNGFIDEVRSYMAISSFTKVCDSRLMWGYYCNGLKGFCIIYNRKRLLRSGIELEDVIYINKGHEVNVFDFAFGYRTADRMKLIDDIPKFKHKEWEHENEIRSLYTLSDNEVGNGATGTTIKLKEPCIDGIIIGKNVSDTTRTKILELSRQQNFSVFIADANLEEFRVEVREFS